MWFFYILFSIINPCLEQAKDTKALKGLCVIFTDVDYVDVDDYKFCVRASQILKSNELFDKIATILSENYINLFGVETNQTKFVKLIVVLFHPYVVIWLMKFCLFLKTAWNFIQNLSTGNYHYVQRMTFTNQLTVIRHNRLMKQTNAYYVAI